ncbi:putative Protein phosphatase 2C [Paratrimastix pyriformis]|uniref:PPM-type phosphatase domain-containing protein n=1 Tax=Paratrimastix pyriformis TaxID=342808 RepID=A0ABQ8UB38_9EUKA|nr:putative Protein phosphatase 2C [Paratrimastix pyriformis]
MEDTHVMVPDLSTLQYAGDDASLMPPYVPPAGSKPHVPPIAPHQLAYFGLFDGHGGTFSSRFCADHIHKFICQLVLRQAAAAAPTQALQASPPSSASNHSAMAGRSPSPPAPTSVDAPRPVSPPAPAAPSAPPEGPPPPGVVVPPGTPFKQLVAEAYKLADSRLLPLMRSPARLAREARQFEVASEGCTAVTVLVAGRAVYVANVGDSMAFLARRSDKDGSLLTIPLTTEHSPLSGPEIKRIRARAASSPTAASTHQVWLLPAVPPDERPIQIMTLGFDTDTDTDTTGHPGVSRALGDPDLKGMPAPPSPGSPPGPPAPVLLTAEPDVTRFGLTERDLFMVVACDGFWNVSIPQEVVAEVYGRLAAAPKGHDIVRPLLTADQRAAERTRPDLLQKICDDLVLGAIRDRHSKDNVSVMVLVFQRGLFDGTRREGEPNSGGGPEPPAPAPSG